VDPIPKANGDLINGIGELAILFEQEMNNTARNWQPAVWHASNHAGPAAHLPNAVEERRQSEFMRRA
jgi:hypothetical protein